jgi:hypothetical protein
MEQALRFIADYQWWIYAVLGIVLLFYLRRAIVSRQQGVRSIFKLEQEQLRLRYSRSVMVSALILLVMVSVFMLGNPLRLAPAVTPEPSPSTTGGPLLAPTLTPTAPPPTITATATATRVLPTPPNRPTATTGAAVATEVPQARPAACPDPNRRITSPGINQVVQGNVPVRGTADHPNFDYYKLEVGLGTDPAQWTVVGELHRAPVSGGVLETFNAAAYPPGVYTLRLVVVDTTGNFPEPCQVTITVRR